MLPDFINIDNNYLRLFLFIYMCGVCVSVWHMCVCAQWRPNECIRSHGAGVTGAKSRTQVLWERGVSRLNYKVISPATQAIKDTHN